MIIAPHKCNSSTQPRPTFCDRAQPDLNNDALANHVHFLNNPQGCEKSFTSLPTSMSAMQKVEQRRSSCRGV